MSRAQTEIKKTVSNKALIDSSLNVFNVLHFKFQGTRQKQICFRIETYFRCRAFQFKQVLGRCQQNLFLISKVD
jgi:hypothetical protein